MSKPYYYRPLKQGSADHLRYMAGRAYIKGDIDKFQEFEDLAIAAMIREQEENPKEFNKALARARPGKRLKR